MRVGRRYPMGQPPDDASLEAALAGAHRVDLCDRDGEVQAKLMSEAVPELAAHLGVRPNGPVFDQQHASPFSAVIHRAGDEPRRLALSEDGSLYLPAWHGWAELAAPEACFSWLAEQGLTEPLSLWRHHQRAASTARERWREAMPKRLRGRWDRAHEEMVDESFDAQGLVRALGGILRSQRAVIEDILAWYGAGEGPLDRRPGYEGLPRLLLAGFGFDPIVATIPRLGQDGLAGAARWLLEGPPLVPAIAAPVMALEPSVREGLVEAARRFSDEDAAKLRGRLFPGAFAVPAPSRLLGVSTTVALRRLVVARDGAYAVDGTKLVFLSSGSGRELSTFLSPEPLGALEADVLVPVGALVQRIDSTGRRVAELSPAGPDERLRARTRLETETAPPAPGLFPILPDDESIRAHEAYAHLGFTLPLARAYLAEGGLAIVRPGASPERVDLSGRAVAAVATATGLLLALERSGQLVLTWLGDRVDEVDEIGLDLEPRSLRRLLTHGGRALLLVDTGTGQALLEVTRPER